jgi:hypothetical protein
MDHGDGYVVPLVVESSDPRIFSELDNIGQLNDWCINREPAATQPRDLGVCEFVNRHAFPTLI